MNFNDISVGQIITFITSTGIITGFSYKIFSLFNQVKINKENIKWKKSCLKIGNN